jgi:hypothetical protein
MLSQYSGILRTGTNFVAFAESVKKETRELKLPADTLKFEQQGDDFTVVCNGDVANVIRSRKNEIVRFRCSIVAVDLIKKKEKE